MEFKKKNRALRVSLKEATFTSILADDTKNMSEICQTVLERIGPENAIDLEVLLRENDEENCKYFKIDEVHN